MTDEELERYISLYRTSVYKTALCCTKDPFDADDIMQDVFLKLYTYSGSFGSDEHVKAWLLRCTVNAGRNLLRSHWRRNSVPLDSIAEQPAPVNDSDGGLLQLVMKLGRNDRVAMYMHYYEGYPIDEVAHMLGISRAAVTSRLSRGRKKLAKLLEEERKENDELQRDF